MTFFLWSKYCKIKARKLNVSGLGKIFISQWNPRPERNEPCELSLFYFWILKWASNSFGNVAILADHRKSNQNTLLQLQAWKFGSCQPWRSNDATVTTVTISSRYSVLLSPLLHRHDLLGGLVQISELSTVNETSSAHFVMVSLWSFLVFIPFETSEEPKCLGSWL